MIASSLLKIGLRPLHLQMASFGLIVLCVSLWVRAKTIGEDERGNAERRALFVGLWPPTVWLIGETLARHESPRRALLRR